MPKKSQCIVQFENINLKELNEQYCLKTPEIQGDTHTIQFDVCNFPPELQALLLKFTEAEKSSSRTRSPRRSKK